MTKVYMLTIPQEKCSKILLARMVWENDTKKWIIASEKGRGGYKHWQVRIKVSNPNFFGYEEKQVLQLNGTVQKVKVKVGWVAENMPFAFCEEAQDEWIYERKECNFVSSEDTKEILKIRFGKMKENQERIVNECRKQGDRCVTVCYDSCGNHGKSWLTIHLYERGHALVVPRASSTAEKLSGFVCSAYSGEEFIIIDIPRARPVTAELYEAIEELKDGLVFDYRYQGRCRNIRGAKVLVFTNSKLDLSKLSTDRWHAIDYNGHELPITEIAQPPKVRKTKKKTLTLS